MKHRLITLTSIILAIGLALPLCGVADDGSSNCQIGPQEWQTGLWDVIRAEVLDLLSLVCGDADEGQAAAGGYDRDGTALGPDMSDDNGWDTHDSGIETDGNSLTHQSGIEIDDNGWECEQNGETEVQNAAGHEGVEGSLLYGP